MPANNVLYWSTIIGQRTSNGFGSTELIVVFNCNATSSIVQQLVRTITLKTVGGSAGMRRLQFSMGDGEGGQSDVAVKTVNVS